MSRSPAENHPESPSEHGTCPESRPDRPFGPSFGECHVSPNTPSRENPSGCRPSSPPVPSAEAETISPPPRMSCETAPPPPPPTQSPTGPPPHPPPRPPPQHHTSPTTQPPPHPLPPR